MAIGVVDPVNVKRNAGAQPGDALILGKPLGVGIYSAALKKGLLSAEGYAAMLASTTQLNTPGIALGKLPGVHALTDVTGFGLLGHLLEICRGSVAAATIDFARLPLLPDALRFARDGVVTGASGRNWAGYGDDVDVGRGPRQRRTRAPHRSADVRRTCSSLARPATWTEILALFRAEGFAQAAVIGEIAVGMPRVTVR